ncbi:MAG TPA: ABC transporter substrate-binding protein [Acidimicrobiia bacterium]|nr:ABC transporter substrate-binding protein [Acidimicrobiia bacterium]
MALVATIVLATAGTSVVASAQAGDKPAASDIGVTAKEIHVAVVADVDNTLAPALFQGSVAGMESWAKYINKNGGLAERKVVIDFIDSKLNADEARNGVIKACSDDFALVGTSALFLNNVDDVEACVDGEGAATGLPDIAVVTTEIVQQCSPTTYGINPPQILCDTLDQSPQTYQGNAGRAFYYQKKFGKDLHGAYIFSSDLKAAENANRASMTQMQTAGSGIKEDFEALISGRSTQPEYTPIVQQLKDNESNYAQSGSSFNSTVLMRKEAKLQGITDPDFIWDCTLQCYDPKLLEQGGSDIEGQYVSTLFLPFEEKSSNKMLANFLKFTDKDKLDGFAIQAFASGLLFQQAVEQAVEAGGVNNVTRAAVFEQLDGINDFDAGGMIGITDVGARETTPCYALTQVQSGKFKRVWPKKAGTFDCKPRNRVEVELDLVGG